MSNNNSEQIKCAGGSSTSKQQCPSRGGRLEEQHKDQQKATIKISRRMSWLT